MRRLDQIRNVAEMGKPAGLSLQDVLAIFTKGRIGSGVGYAVAGPVGAAVGGLAPEAYNAVRLMAAGARLLRELEVAEPGSAKYNLLMQTIKPVG